MKIYGYIQKRCNEHGLVELSEVTLAMAPEKLRQVALFFQNAADEMETSGSGFGHLHIQDEIEDWCDSSPEPPDIIVAA
jgi:hypothetical protein